MWRVNPSSSWSIKLTLINIYIGGLSTPFKDAIKILIEVKNKFMIVKIKQTEKKNSWEGGFKSPRFKGAKDILTAFYDKFGSRITGLSKEDEVRLGDIFKVDLNSVAPFWDDYKVIIGSKGLTLNTDKPEDELKYLLLKAHYRVRESVNDMSKPNADYVIVNEEIEADSQLNKADVRIKAYTTFANLTSDQKADILRLYPSYTRTDNVSPKVIEAKLLSEMEKDFAKFNRLTEDANRDMKVFLKDLVSANILTKNRNAYKYGNDVLGHNDETTIEFLNDPENQSLKVSLMKELKEFNKRK